MGQRGDTAGSGRKRGRKPTADALLAEIDRRLAAGETRNSIAKALRCSRWLVQVRARGTHGTPQDGAPGHAWGKPRIKPGASKTLEFALNIGEVRVLAIECPVCHRTTEILPCRMCAADQANRIQHARETLERLRQIRAQEQAWLAARSGPVGRVPRAPREREDDEGALILQLRPEEELRRRELREVIE